MRIGRLRLFAVSLFSALALICTGSGIALAESPCQTWVAKLVSLQGVAEVRHAGRDDWQSAGLEDTFCEGDTIRVRKDGRAAVQLRNDALLRLDQETSLTFSGIEDDRTYVINLIKGAAHFFSRGSRSLKVVTPYVNAAVEGTEFQVTVSDEEAKIALLQGRVLLENDQGEVSLAKGQVGVARTGKAPASYVMVSPRDAVKWTLYYPRVIQVSPGALPALPDSERLVYQAGEKLGLGQVDSAESDIGAALFLDPYCGDAISLKSVIAVVTGRKEEALKLAEKAVSVAPRAASARIALSYARQAAFDLKGALADMETATRLEPENALVWSRLSELRLDLADVSGALEAAHRATAIRPDLSLTQTVLGFAYLELIKVKAAVEAFETAISLDSSAPLPHLGLGLAKIRQGDLAAGRRLLEVAAGLDSANSVFRSYLGKAYYEEKRDKFAKEQFAMAKELDPRDPTPWLYDAIRKQSINQPVEALRDLYQSIRLNDNRAVYRSRFQLDQDLAVRGVSLARVYNDLGFQQLGLLEGWKSLNTDPGNYSAHRLLADSYSALPHHEIARVSELLQAQLLQPVNSAPIQAGLTKTNLSLMESSLLGSALLPTDFSMMTRNEIRLQATGLTGSNDLLGGDVAVSGIQDRFSFSIGQNYFSTDGFRENNDQTGKLTNAFAQFQLTDKTSLQAEYRYADGDNGDLNALFDAGDYWPQWRESDTGTTWRGGFHHQFSPGADLLLSGIYQSIEEGNTNLYNFPGGMETGFEFHLNYEDFLYEAQQQLRFKGLTMSIGAGYFKQNGKRVQSIRFDFLPTAVVDTTSIEENQVNVYMYANTTFPENVTWTFGGDYSSYDDSETKGDQFSPKFGVTWQLTGNTTLYTAVFKTLNRLLPETRQTIEPTQIAGFNQFFDDADGTETWLYGIGLDHTFSRSFYGGIKYFQRDMEVPFLVASTPTAVVLERQVADWTNETSTCFLYWTPHTWLSTSLEIYHEHLKREAIFGSPSGLSKLDTYRVPLSLRFFHPSGILAGLKESYVQQEGEFGDSRNGYVPGSDAFWVTDIFIGYRLPKRRGAFTLEVRNLFDNQFSFEDSDPTNPSTVPERVVLGRLSLSF